MEVMFERGLVRDVLLRKLGEHSKLTDHERAAIAGISAQPGAFRANTDLVRQGDRPTNSIIVLSGMVGRYHTRANGGRQYLSFHIAGDMPDAQSLYLDQMDHAVCAMDNVKVAMVPHRDIVALFKTYPGLGLAIWRETLIDAAIFREAITNNSSRGPSARMAHFFCEQHHRAQAVGLMRDGAISLPLSQAQIGETLGMSLVTVNRTVQHLRRTGMIELKDGLLEVRDTIGLAELGEFDHSYLHRRRVLD